MVDQFHDFDAAWADEDDEPVVIKLLGEEWKCKRPSEVPAALLLRLDRLLLSVATGDVPDDMVVDDSLSPESILRQLAGDDNVDAWLGRGLPYKRLMAVNRHLTAVYRGQNPAGEAPAANRQQRRAAAKKKGSGSATS
ncbi:hypothetical protein [Blastococcus sp. CT_GayMR16]|uniref:hypothetical protein n=1 Tax=Blastococcus sp. CT_GayMR16 TaxID=2559607 RepID=UPI0010740516|nr:hypothetical protein [Blastococcus sp. CT_GayMR16]TFV91409.1 hypothetical protein E4P38_02135 [Blastococcus sp. CT_GayMR16]